VTKEYWLKKPTTFVDDSEGPFNWPLHQPKKKVGDALKPIYINVAEAESNLEQETMYKAKERLELQNKRYFGLGMGLICIVAVFGLKELAKFYI
jgi:hypothetical protein